MELESLDAYRIVRAIGSGGMGTVFEAEDVQLGRRVALKRLHPHISERPDAVNRFLSEGRAVARIRHSNVVQVFALGTDGVSPFLVMELLTGRDLATRFANEGRSTVADALGVVLPVVAGIAAAHDAGVIHRDLKPSNLFLADGPKNGILAKVVDFGASAIVRGDAQDLITAEAVVGTLPYMAPEQVRRAISFQGDQYAIAVILYEFVTGKRPFTGDHPCELLEAIMTACLVPPSRHVTGVPPEFDAIVLRAMSRDPAARFPSMRAFGRALLDAGVEGDRARWAGEFDEPSSAAPSVEPTGREPLCRADTDTLPITSVSSIVDPRDDTTRTPASPPVACASRSNDGVAATIRGDVLMVLWNAPIRRDKVDWTFVLFDELLSKHPSGCNVTILLPTASPPDRQTSMACARRLSEIESAVRCWSVVTLETPDGPIWYTITGAIARAVGAALSSRVSVTSSLSRGVRRVERHAGTATPSTAELCDGVHALFDALDVPWSVYAKAKRGPFAGQAAATPASRGRTPRRVVSGR